ncbi:MAG: hypothetical protein Q8P42_01530 [Gallionella sp.]|nr:hypothetical protein [Gallionella sp.]
MIQRTEDGGQRTEALSRRSRALNKCAAQRYTNLCLPSSVFCLLMSVLCPLEAEELTDPTRPPASITAPVPASGVEAAPAPAGLQSIIISKNRRAAIIDGETVELGGKHADAKLIEVNEGGVVLRGAQGRQVMSLFPGVKMTTAKVPVENKEQKLKTTPQSSKSQAQPGNKKAKQPATGEKK